MKRCSQKWFYKHMIIEKLLPKPIKEHAARFRAMGCLNNAALEHLKKQYLATLVITALLIAFLWAVGESAPAAILCIFLPVLPWLHVKSTFDQTGRAYAEKGTIRPVIVTKVIIGRYGEKRIRYREIDGQKEHLIKFPGTPFTTINHPSDLRPELLPTRGDTINIYQDNDSKYPAMPDIPNLKRIYSLTADIF